MKILLLLPILLILGVSQGKTKLDTSIVKKNLSNKFSKSKKATNACCCPWECVVRLRIRQVTMDTLQYTMLCPRQSLSVWIKQICGSTYIFPRGIYWELCPYDDFVVGRLGFLGTATWGLWSKRREHSSFNFRVQYRSLPAFSPVSGINRARHVDGSLKRERERISSSVHLTVQRIAWQVSVARHSHNPKQFFVSELKCFASVNVRCKDYCDKFVLVHQCVRSEIGKQCWKRFPRQPPPRRAQQTRDQWVKF